MCVCSLCAPRALYCFQGNYLPSSLVSVAHFVFTLHFVSFPFSVSISFFVSGVGERRSKDSKRKEKRLRPRYEDFLTCVGGGCKLMLSSSECLVPNELWDTASEPTSIKTNYSCCFAIQEAGMVTNANRPTQSHTVSLGDGSNEVMHLCSLTYDLLKRLQSPRRYLLKSESQQWIFSTLRKQKLLHEERPTLFVSVCVIYLTVQLGLPSVSASKHSHGNQTQPNPIRCPGVCV